MVPSLLMTINASLPAGLRGGISDHIDVKRYNPPARDRTDMGVCYNNNTVTAIFR